MDQTTPAGASDSRNGKSTKTVLTGEGALRIQTAHDRKRSFEPQWIGKHERHFTGFDDKIIAMYARGMAVREIQGYRSEIYAVDASPDLISHVTDAVVRNKAVYPPLGVLPDHSRDILGLWIETTEDAKFWMKVFNNLRTRRSGHVNCGDRRPKGHAPKRSRRCFPPRRYRPTSRI